MSAEWETFDEMAGTISGFIKTGLPGLCTKAISMRLMVWDDVDELKAGGASKREQCNRFLAHFSGKIEGTPSVLDDFVKMLDVAAYDPLVKQISK